MSLPQPFQYRGSKRSKARLTRVKRILFGQRVRVHQVTVVCDTPYRGQQPWVFDFDGPICELMDGDHLPMHGDKVFLLNYGWSDVISVCLMPLEKTHWLQPRWLVKLSSLLR